MLPDIERQYPARYYVMIDDKLQILAAMKDVWGKRLTTIFPRQGHYATDSADAINYPAPDIALEHIRDLINVDIQALLESHIACDQTEENFEDHTA